MGREGEGGDGRVLLRPPVARVEHPPAHDVAAPLEGGNHASQDGAGAEGGRLAAHGRRAASAPERDQAGHVLEEKSLRAAGGEQPDELEVEAACGRGVEEACA